MPRLMLAAKNFDSTEGEQKMTIAKRLNDLGTGKIEAPKIRPEKIIIRQGFNFRDTSTPEVRAHIDWLKRSILESGVREPVDVEFTDGKVYLVAGECRTIAAQELRKQGWDGWIPAIAVRGDEPTVLANSIIDNGGLLPSILEFGQAFSRLGAYGWDVERIANYVPTSVANTHAKARKFVQDALELHEAPLEVKEAVAKGVEGVTVSPAAAVAATRKGRLLAGENLRQAAKAAKAAGKTTVRRPKGEGKAAKAKKSAAEEMEKLLRIGDRMAEQVLSLLGMMQNIGQAVRFSAAERLARQWQKGRE